jgi:hypothetical protein
MGIEQTYQGPESADDGLASLRSRLGYAVEMSRAGKEASFSDNFNIEDLKKEDLLMLWKAENGGLPMGEFNRWKMEVLEEEKKMSGVAQVSHWDAGSRAQFAGFLSGILEFDKTKEGDMYRVMKGALPK